MTLENLNTYVDEAMQRRSKYVGDRFSEIRNGIPVVTIVIKTNNAFPGKKYLEFESSKTSNNDVVVTAIYKKYEDSGTVPITLLSRAVNQWLANPKRPFPFPKNGYFTV